MKQHAFLEIFRNQLNQEEEAYIHYANKMANMVQKQKGYLGHFSFRNEDGFGVTLSYWEDEAAILQWKNEAAHQEAQEAGQKKFYAHYSIEIGQILRSYSFSKDKSQAE